MKNQDFRLNSSFWVVILVLMCTIWGITGCSSATKRVKGAQESTLEAYEMQKPIEVTTSEDDSRPDWTKKTVFEDEGKVFFPLFHFLIIERTTYIKLTYQHPAFQIPIASIKLAISTSLFFHLTI